MKLKFRIQKAILLLLIMNSCSKEDEIRPVDLVVAFENRDTSFSSTEENKEIKIVFSHKATEPGNIIIKTDETGAVYGKDYSINSEFKSGKIILFYNKGDQEVSFVVNKLNNADLGEIKMLNFEIEDVVSNVISQGNTSFILSFTEVATSGAVFFPEVGGANQPNQVYVDLSAQNQTTVKRDSWDLGFYSGDEFSVKINGSIFMGAVQLNETNLNEISESDVMDLKPLITTNIENTSQYFDDPIGDITKTAIGQISEVVTENKVYLLKLGYQVSNTNPPTGSVDLSGDLRGWKKIRITRNNAGYILQYADLDDTSYKEITISKDSNYNFTFFSFDTESIVNVEPQQNKWDLNFTVFTNVINFGDDVYGGYGFSDFTITNTLGKASSYEVLTKDFTFNNFELSDVDDVLFTQDQTTIGSNWRSVFTKLTLNDRFYILKDTDDNIYKIKFNALVNESGERGYPSLNYIKISE